MSKTKSAIAAFANSTIAYASVTITVTLLVIPARSIDATLILGSLILGGIVSGLAVAITALAGRTAHQIGFYTAMNVLSSVALLAGVWATRDLLFGVSDPIGVSQAVIGFAAIAGYGLISGLAGSAMTRLIVRS